ncbi:MAG: insulinase family protein [Pegethrix bostrychoides GSE-TBD4-15B]|jgi:predicted Zn-dependent peptidase|uniref:Insulinase family protein n=1 Tax=Pegethrix bostrychoides GSE-TBD4-15B TaxID=2839662 RepID=A0A951PDE8_9CYAN|nr:insulinase family protein [Pegethrix bostrychoides GSE-TBD4-15B]
MTSTLVNAAASINAPTLRRLPNGLTIIAEQMPVEAVNLSLWMGVGSAVETDEINGMAHFLEHMIFKGTRSLQSGEFEQKIEQAGAVTNAATSQDYTCYYITTAPQDFAKLAPLQVEVLRNATIPDAAFERERSVVLEEIRRSEDNARRRTYYRSMEAAFERLPYRRPVLGPASVIEQLSPQQMRDFHSTWYRPQSTTASVVGNLPVEELIEIVAQSFEQAEARAEQPNSLQKPPEAFVSEPESPFTTVRRQVHIDESLQQARLVMMWRVPGMADLSQTYALDALAAVLGQGRTARFVRDLREERGLVSSISVSNMTYVRQGLFYIAAQLPSENLEAVETAILTHIRQLQVEAISEAELQRVRTIVANRYVFGNETPSDRASLYGYYQAVLGDLTPALTYPAQIQALTPQVLQAAVQQYLSPDAYQAVILKSA